MLLEKLFKSGQVVQGTDDGEWTTEVPTEPNTLWFFYGWTDGRRKGERGPDLMTVGVWQSGPDDKPFLAYVGHGQFLYPNNTKGLDKDRCMFGKWKRIGPITLPPME